MVDLGQPHILYQGEGTYKQIAKKIIDGCGDANLTVLLFIRKGVLYENLKHGIPRYFIHYIDVGKLKGETIVRL